MYHLAPESRPTITAVIPAFNEARRIAACIADVRPHVQRVIVVDDASQDSTASLASAAGAEVIRRAANGGYIAAIKSGIAVVNGGIVVTIDADGEFCGSDIPALLAPIMAGRADMVQGQRPTVPRPSERVISWLARRRAATGDSGTGLRAMHWQLAQSLKIEGVCICGVLALEAAAMGARIVDVPVQLRGVRKTRRVAWFHLRQSRYLIPWLLKRYP